MTRLFALALAFVLIGGSARADTVLLLVEKVDQAEEAAVSLVKATVGHELQEKGWTVREAFDVKSTPIDVAALATCMVDKNAACVDRILRAATEVNFAVLARVEASGPVNGVNTYKLVLVKVHKSGTSSKIDGRSCSSCTAATLEAHATELTSAVLRASEPPGTLKITSDPSGAIVRLDGEAVGVTPLELAVETGAHVISFTKEGFVTPPDITVVVESRAVVPVSRTLAPISDGDGAVRGPLSTMKWVTGGTGLVMVGGGLVALLVLDDPPKQGGDRAKTRWNVPGYIGVAAGGACLVASVVMFVLDRPSKGPKDENRVDVGAFVLPGAFGVSATGRF